MKKLIFVFLLISFFKFGISQDDCVTSYTKAEISRIPCSDIKFLDSIIFVSTYYGGLYKIEGDYITSIDTFNSSLPDTRLNNMCKYLDGMAFTYGYGSHVELYLFDIERESFKRIVCSNEISKNYQTTDYGHAFPFVIKSKDSLILAGTSAGLLIYKNGKFNQIQDLNNDGKIEFVYDIDLTSDITGSLCTNSGLFTINYETFDIQKVVSQPCFRMAQKQDDELYFTTKQENKLFKISNNILSTVAESNSIISFEKVNDIEIDSDENLLFITSKDVVLYNNHEFKNLFNIADGVRIDVEDDKIIAGGFSQVKFYECDSITGINMIIEDDPFSIFPQIVENEISISFDREINLYRTNFKIINSIGYEVYNDIPEMYLTRVNLSNYPKGIYYIIILTENNLYTQTFYKY